MSNMLAEVALAIGRSPELSIVVKATVLLTVALVGTDRARRARASVRHVAIASTFAVLVVLPIAAVAVPPVVIEVPLSREGAAISPPPDVRPTDTHHPGQTSGTASGTRVRRMSALALIRAAWTIGVTIGLVPLVAALWRLRRVRTQGARWPKGEGGLVHPVIVLPAEAQEWSDADVERAVIHELEHVHRADWPIRVMARVVSALYWFHPLVWMAWRRLCLESERACDDAVLRAADRTAYADQLVTLARRLSTSTPRSMLSMANRSDLSVRVSAVLDSRQSRGRAGLASSSVTAIAAVVLSVAMAPLVAVGRLATSDRPIEFNRQPATTEAGTFPPRTPWADTTFPPGVSTPSQPVLNTAQASAQAQQRDSSSAAFVSTSVKANTSGDVRGYPFTLESGRFAVTNITLRNLITNAYQGFRIEGGPEWLSADRFDIEAKAEGNPTAKEMWPMVRQLLAGRFSLNTHIETRVDSGYALMMTSGTLGPRLRTSACFGRDSLPRAPIDPSLPLPCGLYRGRPLGWFEARWVTMNEFAFGLTGFVGRSVVDRTGLTGKFDVQVEWTPAPGPPGPSTIADGSTIFASFEQQLGLTLSPEDSRSDVLVIDHVERPTPD